MNREDYFEYLRLDSEVRERAEEIFRYATRDDKRNIGIDSINFEEEKAGIMYSHPQCSPQWIEFPSELLFADNWKSRYNLLIEKSCQEEEHKKLEEKKRIEEGDISRRAFYRR